MLAGLTVFTDQGTMQIDSNFKTVAPAFRLTYTGPYANGSSSFIGNWYQFTITVPSDVKYLFFASPVDRTIGLMKKSGTDHTYRTSAQGTVEVYGFKDTPAQASTGNFGLQLFNEEGVLTFDSSNNFMKVANVFTVPTTGMKVEPWPEAGNKYAVGLGVYPKQWRGAAQAGVPWGVMMSYCVRVGPTAGGGGYTAIASRPWGSDTPPNDTPQAPPPTARIVEVTGL